MNEGGDVLGGERRRARGSVAPPMKLVSRAWPSRGTVGEERGIPDGAERAEFFGARNEETEAIQRVANGGFWITEGNDSEGGKFDFVEPEILQWVQAHFAGALPRRSAVLPERDDRRRSNRFLLRI